MGSETQEFVDNNISILKTEHDTKITDAANAVKTATGGDVRGQTKRALDRVPSSDIEKSGGYTWRRM